MHFAFKERPGAYVIVFRVKKTHGTYGTKLDAVLPPIASKFGYTSAFNLALKRNFSSHGQSRSYLSANCPVPKGINPGLLPPRPLELSVRRRAQRLGHPDPRVPGQGVGGS